MGFTTGFTGGVAVTLSVAYLTVLAHQRNRDAQGASLRAQALALQNLVDPLPAPLPPTRTEVAAARRDTTIEVAKDRWNHEIENAVRWAQTTDWVEVRERVERGASRLWAQATGATPEEEIQKIGAEIEKQGRKVERKAEAASGGVADAARAAYGKAKSRTLSVEEAAENKILEARLRAGEKTAKVEGEAKSALASAWETGKDKARELADKAKAAVNVVEETIEAKLEGGVKPVADPVAKALNQRYQRPEAKVNKTVAEVLQERYTPISKRDNTVLRGI